MGFLDKIRKKRRVELKDIPPLPNKEEISHFPQPKDIQVDKKSDKKEEVTVRRIRDMIMDRESKEKSTIFSGAEKRADGPIFIRAQRYQLILDHLSHINNDLDGTEDSLESLSRLNKSKNISHDNLRASFNNIQDKLFYIDQSLFKKGK